MKLRYLLALPILATALMGCDEIEYSDAKPVENPELPGVTTEGFTVTNLAFVNDGLNLQQVLDYTALENIEAANYVMPLYTITVVTEDLPSGYEITSHLQLARQNDPEFTNPFDVIESFDYSYENGEIKTVKVTTTLADLLSVRSSMYGNDPRPCNIPYRLSVVVSVDGGQFQYFYQEGKYFNEIGVTPNYDNTNIEDAYYLVGPNGTDLSKAIKFEHSGYNVYDDTDFSVVANFSETNNTWLVVPQSVYESGSLNKALCLGPTETTALTGLLKFGGNAGEVTVDEAAGLLKYKISMDMATLQYKVEAQPIYEYGDPVGIYIKGDMNGWNAEASYEFIATDTDNEYILPYVTIQQGVGFKIADANWSEYNFGAPDGTTAELGLNAPYLLTSGGGSGNLTLAADFTGAVILTQEEDGWYVTFQTFDAATAGQPSGIYLRGDMNGWGVESDYEFQTSEYAGVWYLNDQTIEAGVPFKVADKDWGSINYGANLTAGSFDETAETGILGLVFNAGNIDLEQNFNGDLRLVEVNNHYYLFFILN